MARGEGSASRKETPRWEPAAAVALTLVVAALHLVRVAHAGGLWRDEAGAARLATLPTLGEIYHLFPHEAFPLLFPTVLRAWTGLTGGGDPALRAFGLAVGLGLVGLLWWNARATAGTVPLLSLALVGLDLPFLVYGDSVRGYGLGSAAVLVTYGLLARIVGRTRTEARRAAWTDTPALAALALAMIASVQLVLSNACLVAALGAAAVAVAAGQRRWRQVGEIAGCGALAALSLLPYAAPLAAARRQWSFIVVYSIGLGRLRRAFGSTLGPPVVRWVWLLLIVAAMVAGIALVREWRRNGERAAESVPDKGDAALFAALVLPFALLANGAFLKLLGYTPRPWYFLPLLALLATALDTVGGALSRSGGRFVRWKGVAVCLVAAAAFLPLARYAALRQTNVDLVAQQVARAAGPADLVVVDPWYYGVSFNRYYRGVAPWRTLPDLPDHRVHRYDLLKGRLAASHPIDDVLAAVAATLRSGHRVFRVGAAWPLPGENAPILPALPAALPPAPESPEGWHDWPYVVAWSRQLGAFLAVHAVRAADLTAPVDEPVSGFEDLPLVVAEGWRDQ